IKTARKYAAEHKGADHFTVVTLQNSFHGRTLATLAATGQEVFHKDFLPLTPGFASTPANDAAALMALAKECKAAAIMMEPVQGEGGVMPLDEGFVQAVAAFAAKEDILLIVDEVQTGNGRTGTLYAYEQYGITPDIVTTAKGLGGGLPIGATLFGEKVQDTLRPGDHGSTFGGNPVCCAGAISVLSRIDDALLDEVRKKSAYIFEELTGAPGVDGVSGLGLMIGVATQKPAGEVVKSCLENGVLCLTAKTKVRLLPALNIPWEELKTAVAVLKAACAG
ncbi:MAG: aminotransferase class III-fold pyridoxal phosphate-dependent enzyme, partial [Acutalibacteraceae bacterium]